MASKNVNEMRYSTRSDICRLLDISQDWKLLAGEIGLSVDKILHLELSLSRPGGSPTSDLLTIWSHQNATVEMLASALLQLKLLRAAELLRGIVPDTVFNDASEKAGSDSKNEPELPSLPVPSQAFMKSGQKKEVPCHKPPTEFQLPGPDGSGGTNYRNFEPLPMNIGIQKHEYSKAHSKTMPDSSSKHKRPLDTWSENVTPNSDFEPSCKFKEDSDVFHSQGSSVFARVPVESPDVTNSMLSTDLPLKNQTPNLKQVEPVAATNRSDNVICSLLCYRYVDIIAATNNFHEDNMLGRGGFGIVYRGNIKKTTFAIKVLQKREDSASSHDFLAEINSLFKFRHKNIIMLSGCSVDGPAVCLVYEYMVNGSLQDRLDCKNNSRPLSWVVRHSILKDAAAGLQYLHTVDAKPLIHGDVKSANILLGSHFEAKISDFGLAKEATGGTVPGKFTHVSRKHFEKVYGSRAYLPADFFTGGYQFNIKTDSYSFGIVIFETCTGEKPEDPRREGGNLLDEYVRNVMANNKSHLVTVKDKKALDWPNDLWLEVMSLGLSCTSETKKQRPEMTEVHSKLEDLHQEMQLKRNSGGKLAGSNSDSFSEQSFVASEKSFHLSHQSNPTPQQSLDAQNRLFLEDISPFKLQEAFDCKKQNRFADKDTDKFCSGKDFSTFGYDAKKLCETDDSFYEMSLNEDGSKKSNISWSQSRHASQHAVIPDQDENLKEIQTQSMKSNVLNNNSDFNKKKEWVTSSQNLESVLGNNSDKNCNYPSECMKNFENEQKEGRTDIAPDNLFLEWQQEQKCKELNRSYSNERSCDSELIEELQQKKQKKFPGFAECGFDNDARHDDTIQSAEIEHLKNKMLNMFDTYDSKEDMYENKDIKFSQNTHSKASSDVSKQNTPYQATMKSIENYRVFPKEGQRVIDFVPPDHSLEPDNSVTTGESGASESGRRQMLIAEDLRRAEKLEKLRRIRYE